MQDDRCRRTLVRDIVVRTLERYAEGGRLFGDVAFATRVTCRNFYDEYMVEPSDLEVHVALRSLQRKGKVKCCKEGTKYWWYWVF